MRTIWRIYTRDVMRILRNPVALVVTLGVAIIPSLYAWFNILANWDPYSATGNLQVAVANDDKGTTNDLVGKLNAGQQVVAELKKNTSLGWRFVNEEQAIAGVQSGEYYAAIVLPNDFSENLVGSVTGSKNKPQIKYYVNEKKNAIAPKITDTGATTIDSQINATFVSTVAETVAKTITDAGNKIGDAANDTQDNAIGDLNTVLKDLDDVQKSLSGLETTIDQSGGTIDDAKRNVADLKSTIAAARLASGNAGSLLTQAQSSTQDFSTTLVGKLDDSSAQLSALAVNANQAAGTITGTFNQAQDSVDSVTEAINKPLGDIATTISSVKDALNKAGVPESTDDPIGKRIWSQVNAIDKAVQTQQTQVDTFHKNTTQFITSGKDATGNLSGALTNTATGGIATLNTARGSLTGTIVPNISASLTSFSALNGTLNGTLTSLDATLDQTSGLLDQLATTLSQTKTTLSTTRSSLRQVSTDVSTVRTDIAALDSSAAYSKIRDTLNLDSKGFGEFMGTPVTLHTNVVYPVDNYGSSVTPFYTNLALWVGGFVLIAIYKLEVDRESLKHVTATQAYLGRWMLLITVGFLQAIIACVGDLVLGIQCEHPFLFVLAGVFCSFVYINIIYALAVAFRHIGKAVAVILVIMQIPGASGLYPIELMPDFFRALHPWLPFTYGINAMRGPIAGLYANHYWIDMGHLALYLPAALFVGLVVRRYAMNLNALFDRRLGDTDLMITEHNSMINERVSLSRVFRAVSDSADMRNMIKRRAHRFFAQYPRMIMVGLASLTVLPIVFLVLLFVLPAKIPMLTAWIVSIIVIDTYLIVVEYTRESYARQLGVSAMSADEFRDVMLNGYVWLRPHAAHSAHEGRHAAAHSAGTSTAVPTTSRGMASRDEAATVVMPPVDVNYSSDISEITQELPIFGRHHSGRGVTGHDRNHHSADHTNHSAEGGAR
ncbi:YhgE/Pip domain-containing protein [Bifidobacterium hapali]|uniref:YhgE/Pip domain-containing protein n=1 Tax=Bifidobacterium hapali TaxID=1630172 RepID=A0A261G045_9BIFI|nr:YhgE/Pip domain-containing protein [Bifidobacterium hapali]OZG64812.1 YhgE/Pip domain-containing protein [Bifidobacterium hapali]